MVSWAGIPGLAPAATLEAVVVEPEDVPLSRARLEFCRMKAWFSSLRYCPPALTAGAANVSADHTAGGDAGCTDAGAARRPFR